MHTIRRAAALLSTVFASTGPAFAFVARLSAEEPLSGGRESAAVVDALPIENALSVRLDPGAISEAYTGRVYIVIGGEGREPRRRMGDWFNPPKLFSRDVKHLAPGSSVAFDATWLFHPVAAGEIPAGTYQVQAIARRNADSPDPGDGAGDLYSKPVTITVGENARVESPRGAIALDLTETVKARVFRETDRLKLVEMVSPSLSAFHGREYKVQAGVLLPTGFDPAAGDAYPVVYAITGFGGDHHSIQYMGGIVPPDAADQVVLVVPNPLCFRGHSVFADSANNGPWGRMLVEELAPEIDRRFKGAGASQRYVTGVSSGGWSSLWLQITYPDAFSGCWSHVPDPVDFRDFQRIDLYAPGANMYRDSAGERRPIARQGDVPRLWYEDFVRRERVLGPGGQIHSFEAVFSQRGPDGEPASLFDRETGAVDTAVARTWEPYDIRLVMERRWSEIGPKVAGKIHVYGGEVDNYYLEGAVRLLKPSLSALGSDAAVEIVPGMGHTLHTEGNAAMFRTILERRRSAKSPVTPAAPASGSGESR